jgi:hypothetical protein
VTCTDPVLQLNAIANITIRSVHPQPANLAVVASVEGDQADPAGANNSLTSNVQVTEPVPPPPPSSGGGGGGGGSFSLWMMLALLCSRRIFSSR